MLNEAILLVYRGNTIKDLNRLELQLRTSFTNYNRDNFRQLSSQCNQLVYRLIVQWTSVV